MEPPEREQPQGPFRREEFAWWCAALIGFGHSLPVHGSHCEGHAPTTKTVPATPEYLQFLETVEKARAIRDPHPRRHDAADERTAETRDFTPEQTRLAEAVAGCCREGRHGDFLLALEQWFGGEDSLSRCRSDLTAPTIPVAEAARAASPPEIPATIRPRRQMPLAGWVLTLVAVAAAGWWFGAPAVLPRRSIATGRNFSHPSKDFTLPGSPTPQPGPPPTLATGSLLAAATDKSHAGERLAASGNLPDALAMYRESLSIHQGLVAGAPRNLAWQRDLADDWTKVADTLARQGNTPDALAAQREAEAIEQAGAQAQPDDYDLQHRLFSCCLSIGDLLLAQNDVAGALAAFRRSTTIGQSLCDRDPGNVAWQRGLALGLQRVADALDSQGNREEALQQSRRALEIEQTLVGHDPTNTDGRNDLAAVEWKVGDLMLAQTQVNEALPHYAAALTIQQKLAESDALNVERQRNLAAAYERMGQALLAKGELAGPEEAFAQALAVRRRLLAQDAANPGRRHEVFLGLTQVGDAQVLTGSLFAALKSYREALLIEQQSDPFAAGDAEWQRGLPETQDKIAQVLEAQGDLAGALPAYREALASSERLAAQHPADESLQEPAATISYHLGRAAARQQPADLITARRSLEHARELLFRLRLVEGTAFSHELAQTLEDTEQLLARMEHP